jgi:Zn-dependent protease
MQDWKDEFAAQIPDEPFVPAVPQPSRPGESDPWQNDPFDVDDSRASAVLAEIDRLQRKKANWGATILILIVSGFLFYAIGQAAWNLKMAALLIPILFFHELGHYLAMLAFGYRNLRMFFIPLFGAAVTGRNYNVAAWKKAVVSLMGPLPGIVVGIVLGFVAIIIKQKVLLEAAGLTVFLNGFNLLPILPLDGGWNLHALLFSRHYLLDVGFRMVAALLMVLGGVLLREYFLAYLGGAMLFGLPMEYRRAQMVARLRKEGFAARSPDSQTIPERSARRIIAEIDESTPKQMGNRAVARLTLQTFESLNARPAGVLAIILLTGLHAAAFVTSLVFSLIFFFAGQHFDANANQAARPPVVRAPRVELPTFSYACGSVRTWRGAQAPATIDKPSLLIATLPDEKTGAEVFAKLTPQLPATTSALLFGQSIVVTLPADAKLEAQINAQLEKLSPDALIEHAKAISCRLSCKIPDRQLEKELKQDASTYFAMTSAFVVPPWSPGFKLSDDERKARATYARIAEVHMRVIMEPRFVDQRKEAFKSVGKGKEAVAKMQETLVRIRNDVNQATADEVRRDKAIDATLLDLYIERSTPPKKGVDPVKRQVDLTLRMAQRMGQLPLENGKPKPGAERFSANGGVRVVGSRLRFDWLSFRQPDLGLPALAQWLCSAHGTDIKYRLTALAAQANDEDDEFD